MTASRPADGRAGEAPEPIPDPRDTLVPIFPTPISNCRWPDSDDLNRTLAELVLAEERRSPGILRSNVGGWHSETAFLTGRLPCLDSLRRRVRTLVTELSRLVGRRPDDPVHERFRLEGWANVLRHGQYNTLHCHPNAFWSGVYYVNGNPPAADGHPFSGRLELCDPRPGAGLVYADHTNLYGRFLVNPSPGQMLIFPGWLQHQVHPYFGSEPRISVAFNVTFEPEPG